MSLSWIPKGNLETPQLLNFPVPEEKLLKVLNLEGLFLQAKKSYGVIPTLLSLKSVVLEFNTPLREWIYNNINLVLCQAIHIICDKMPYSKRRHVYSLGNWVENLKPSNDIKVNVVEGNICDVIGGGDKSHKENVTSIYVHIRKSTISVYAHILKLTIFIYVHIRKSTTSLYVHIQNPTNCVYAHIWKLSALVYSHIRKWSASLYAHIRK
jgi:hypothetical protein